jgi:hypothetical protein
VAVANNDRGIGLVDDLLTGRHGVGEVEGSILG